MHLQERIVLGLACCKGVLLPPPSDFCAFAFFLVMNLLPAAADGRSELVTFLSAPCVMIFWVTDLLADLLEAGEVGVLELGFLDGAKACNISSLLKLKS